MIALGIAGKLLGIGEEFISAQLEKRLADKGAGGNRCEPRGIKAGFAAAADIDFGLRLARAAPSLDEALAHLGQ